MIGSSRLIHRTILALLETRRDIVSGSLDSSRHVSAVTGLTGKYAKPEQFPAFVPRIYQQCQDAARRANSCCHASF